MVVRHALWTIAWYLAINVIAVLPVLGMVWIWSTVAGQGCCGHAPVPLTFLGTAWGGLALLGILMPVRHRKDAVWLYAIAGIAWIRVVLSYVFGVGDPVDGSLRLMGVVLLIGYIAIPSGILRRFSHFPGR